MALVALSSVWWEKGAGSAVPGTEEVGDTESSLPDTFVIPDTGSINNGRLESTETITYSHIHDIVYTIFVLNSEADRNSEYYF